MNAQEFIDKARSLLRTRKRAYQLTFNGPIADNVLTDLARFCRANETAFHPDPRVHAMLEGRREVWLRIQSHLNLPEDKLWALLNQGNRQ